MYNTCNAGLKKLENILVDCETLWEVLCNYTGNSVDMISDINTNYPYEILLDDLRATDTLYSMTEDNDMTESEMEEWLRDHFDNSVECKIFQERGPAGGWPIVKVDCLDMVFFLDWVTE